MLRKALLFICFIRFICLAVSTAETSIYFAGFETKEDLLSLEYPCIYYWNIEEGTCNKTGLYGYVIESNESGVWAIAYEGNEGKEQLLSLLLLEKGMIKERIATELPENCIRVISYKDGTICYVYYENEQDYGIQSIDFFGIKQSYDFDPDIVFETFMDMPVAVDDSQNVIFIDYDSIWISSPGCKARYICDCSKTGAVAYTKNGNIAYVGINGELCFIDRENNMNNKTIPTKIHCFAPCIAVSDNLKYVAYQEYNPQKVLGFLPPKDEDFNKILIVDLETGKTIYSSPYVYIMPIYSTIVFE